MTRIERFREALKGPLDLDYLQQRAGAGWRPVVIEWEREVEAKSEEAGAQFEEVPYGLHVAIDCLHLEENPAEMEVLKLMMALIVQYISLPRMAEELNRKGLRARGGAKWGPVSVFRVLPRVIEVAPRILTSEEWVERRKQFAHVAWNS
jgi:hypothetical protein